VNRDKLEQEAIQLMQRGQAEKALDRYLNILRMDPKDRRIRQRVAEVYLSLGRKAEALRHLTDVARGLASAGQERAALSVFNQVMDLRPDDHELRAELAQAYQVLGRRPEAREAWEEAFRLVDRRDPVAAITYARAVARLAPAEVPLQVRVAELLEASRKEDEAFDAWVALGREARRFGRADDQGRFLERALKLRPDDMDTLLSAAEARIVQGEARTALTHLQRAYGQDARNVRLLTLLGRALAKLGQLDKARKVWIQAARRHAETGDRDAQVDALRNALECGPDDPRLKAELETADAEARRFRVRLDEREWAAPRDEAEVACIVKAQTLRRYGFPDRARQVLEEAGPAVRESLSWRVHMAELLVAADEAAAGVALLRDLAPADAVAQVELRDRLEVLGVPSTPASAEPEHEELVDDEPTDGGEVEAVGALTPRSASASSSSFLDDADASISGTGFTVSTRPAATASTESGDVSAEIGRLRAQLAKDPSNHEVLMRLASLMSQRPPGSARPAPAVPEPASAPRAPVEGTPISLSLPDPELSSVAFGAAFGEVDPDAMSVMDDVIAEARAHLTIGMYEEALDLLRGQEDVEALVVQALASRALGRLDGAQGRLERAVQLGGAHHPAYVEALWELAGLYLLRKKAGNAERLLDEVASLDPTWRPIELSARRRGIELLRAR